MSASLVTWPIGLDDTQEGGMSVVAHWPIERGISGPESLTTGIYGVIVSANGKANSDKVFPGYYDGCYGANRNLDFDIESVELSAAVILGNTRNSWFNKSTEHYWVATREDLTLNGESLMDTLDAIYGVQGVILTVLST